MVSVPINGVLTPSDFIDNDGVSLTRADEFDLTLSEFGPSNPVTIAIQRTSGAFDVVAELIDKRTNTSSGLFAFPGFDASFTFAQADLEKFKIRVLGSKFTDPTSGDNKYQLTVNAPGTVTLTPRETSFNIAGAKSSTPTNPVIQEGELNDKDFTFFNTFTSTGIAVDSLVDEYQLTFKEPNLPIQLSLVSEDTVNYNPSIQIIDEKTGLIAYDSSRQLLQNSDEAPLNPNSSLNFKPIGETKYRVRVTSDNALTLPSAKPFKYKLIAEAEGVQKVTLTPRSQTPPPSISISDAQINEGNSGTSNLTLTAKLSAPSTQTVTVNYATADGTATAGSDYTATNGTLTFNANETEKTFVIPIAGDTTNESNETVFVNLTNPINATLGDAQGVGTIINDDTSTPTPSGPLTLKGGTAQIAYVAYYGRPADVGGLTFWNNNLTTSGVSYSPRGGDLLTGNEQGVYNKIVNDFGNSEEANRLFGGFSGNRDKVNQVYQFVFNRDGDTEGLNYWTQQIDNRSISLANFALEVALGAQNKDIVVLNNKIASADLFASSMDTPAEIASYAGSADELAGRNWLKGFGDAISTQTQVDSFIATLA